LVVKSDREELIALIKELIDRNEILDIQKQVLDGKIQPSY